MDPSLAPFVAYGAVALFGLALYPVLKITQPFVESLNSHILPRPLVHFLIRFFGLAPLLFVLLYLVMQTGQSALVAVVVFVVFVFIGKTFWK